MTGQPGTLEELADRLWRAEVDRRAIDPLSETRPDLTIDDAYAIQALNVNRRVAAGSSIRGHKAGLTSRPMQRLLRVSEPNAGVLLDDMFVLNGDEVLLGQLIQPRVEAELAFVMGQDLPGPVTADEARQAVAAVVPALEIGDSRIANWRIGLVDTVADNGSSARVVLGKEYADVRALDLLTLGTLISRNGTLVHTGAGAAVLGDPMRCVAWLATKLAASGRTLRAGDIVLSGALHRMVPVFPGDRFRAEFAHLGEVSVRFLNAAAAA